METSEKSLGKISIIIPAYNAAKFIETTLNNLFAQTYHNFEIIIAYDEKSTDNTLSLLQKINEIHPLTIDIGKDTSSGTARNRGFQLAKGEYVIFVDADDEIHPEYLRTMITIFQTHPGLNVVCCDYVKVFESTIDEGWQIVENSPTTYNLLQREEALYMLLWKKIANVPWLFLAKRQYLIDNDISFPNYSFGDDVVYAHKLIANSEKIGRSDKKLYLFIMHETSITHTVTPENWWMRYEKSRNDVINYFQKTDPIYSEDYLAMMKRELIYTSVLLYDYPEFKHEIIKQNISDLPMLHKHDKYLYQLSVICFRISKWAFYHLAKFTARWMKNLTPMGKKLGN
ncbi:glycosyltransferase family 2 protein [Methanorbis furvi]|uniref:Glycosyltransferase 2-like domain-containing protein n=1 Tax=Methanorbis furvi TaxID=3028299 RepID=A0AAE4MD40_9EURY|nr:hypothetical protein [Methanocorpusculaceae archaeon Ag1]